MVMRSWGRHYQSDRSWNTALTVRWLIIWTSRVQCWIQRCAICSRHIDTSTLHTHTYCLSPRTWVSNTGTGILAGYSIGKDDVGAGLLEEEMPHLPNWNIWVGRWWMRPMLRTEDIGLWPLARWQGWPHWSPGHRHHDATWIELSTGLREISHCIAWRRLQLGTSTWWDQWMAWLAKILQARLWLTISHLLTDFEYLFSIVAFRNFAKSCWQLYWSPGAWWQMKVHNIYSVSPVTSQQKAADPGIMLLGWLKRPAPRCPRLKCCDKLINRNPSLPVTPAPAFSLRELRHFATGDIFSFGMGADIWAKIFATARHCFDAGRH